jgi:hypothetical protein
MHGQLGSGARPVLVVLLLRADGHAARASRGVLQRSRHRAGAWRGDAVAAARHRLREPTMLGLDVRPHRGLAHSAGGLGRQVAMAGFLAARNEADLFMVATAFGLGFSGVIPAYVLAVRHLFPAADPPPSPRRSKRIDATRCGASPFRKRACATCPAAAAAGRRHRRGAPNIPRRASPRACPA